MVWQLVSTSSPYVWVDNQSGGYAAWILALVVILLLVVFYKQIITVLGKPRFQYLEWKLDRLMAAKPTTPKDVEDTQASLESARRGKDYILGTRMALNNLPFDIKVVGHSLKAATGLYFDPKPPAPAAATEVPAAATEVPPAPAAK